MYTLEDVEERNQEHPDTFRIASRRTRESLMVGDFVKLIFVPIRGPHGDRMWLELLEPKSAGLYRGKLLNHPVFIKRLKWGDTLEFGPEHVADYERKHLGGQVLRARRYVL